MKDAPLSLCIASLGARHSSVPKACGKGGHAPLTALHQLNEECHTAWESRACVRQAVTLRVDYATADGRGWRGLVRNLSLQGMYIDSALRHVAHEVAPGNLLTLAFVLPSGRPCKLRAIIIHCEHQGCGVEFMEGHPQSLAHLASYWFSLKESAQ